MEKDYTWKPLGSSIHRECDVHPHVQKERAELFDTADAGSTEFEVLNWLYATVRVLKPNLILETGAWKGFGTLALASACKINGFGKVHSIEISLNECTQLKKVLEEQNLADWAEIHCSDSIEFLKQSNLVFDIGFFDSETKIRPSECEIMLDKGTLKKCAVFHDTSPYRSESVASWTSVETQEEYRRKIFEIAKRPFCTGYYDSHLSRGFIALFLKD